MINRFQIVFFKKIVSFLWGGSRGIGHCSVDDRLTVSERLLLLSEHRGGPKGEDVTDATQYEGFVFRSVRKLIR